MDFDIEFREISVDGYERVVECKEPVSGLHCIIAIHSTALGPAVGGTRIHPYASVDEALNDVLRLAEGMTWKAAIVEAGFGGGKAVIIGDPDHCKSEALFAAYAQVLNSFEGKFITGKDMAVTVDDLVEIQRHTHYVIGSSGWAHSGDPCPFTAWGVVLGIQSAAKWLFSSDSLEGRRVAIQGVGGVGARLAEFLFWRGAELVVCDIDQGRVEKMSALFGAKAVSPEEIYSVPCDFFAPCAAGAVLNEETIPQLRCHAVVGCANNQLRTEQCAELLVQRGILYVPDFVVNAGGLFNGVAELEQGGYDPHRVRRQLNATVDTLLSIYRLAFERHESTEVVALELASERLEKGIGARIQPLCFPD